MQRLQEQDSDFSSEASLCCQAAFPGAHVDEYCTQNAGAVNTKCHFFPENILSKSIEILSGQK